MGKRWIMLQIKQSPGISFTNAWKICSSYTACNRMGKEREVQLFFSHWYRLNDQFTQKIKLGPVCKCSSYMWQLKCCFDIQAFIKTLLHVETFSLVLSCSVLRLMYLFVKGPVLQTIKSLIICKAKNLHDPKTKKGKIFVYMKHTGRRLCLHIKSYVQKHLDNVRIPVKLLLCITTMVLH